MQNSLRGKAAGPGHQREDEVVQTPTGWLKPDDGNHCRHRLENDDGIRGGRTSVLIDNVGRQGCVQAMSRVMGHVFSSVSSA